MECPAFYYFLKKSVRKPNDKLLTITNNTVKRCYLQATESGFKVGWRSLLGQVDREIFKDVDLDNKSQYDLTKMSCEHILNFLQKWYHTIYLPEHYAAYTDIILTKQFSSFDVYSKIPIILVGEYPIITLIDKNEQNTIRLHNNIQMKGMAWLVSDALGCDAVGIRHLFMGPHGKMDITEVKFGKKKLCNIESTLNKIGSLITLEINYPSITEKCIQCPFKKKCSL